MLEKILESPLDCKEIQLVHPKGDQSWVLIGRTDVEAETPNTLATSCKELTHWKRPWFWEQLGAGGEGDDRGWDGWMASLTWWTWVWVNSGSWWWTGRPGVLCVVHGVTKSQTWLSYWTELNWCALKIVWTHKIFLLLFSISYTRCISVKPKNKKGSLFDSISLCILPLWIGSFTEHFSFVGFSVYSII